MTILQSERADCLVLNVPDWFAREDFLAWRRQAMTPARGLATWARSPTEAPGEFADIFMTFDVALGNYGAWEASDAEGLPAEAAPAHPKNPVGGADYAAIGQALRTHGLTYGLIWLKNIPLEDPP